jgi:uncharacterized oligopeptide transporter (OPT) family protein
MADTETIIRTITLIVAPVVLLSCCTLFLNGMLTRYNAISDRMRTMHQERFNLLLSIDKSITGAFKAIDGLSATRVREIEEQLPHLLRRYDLMHHAAMSLYIAIVVFIISMFVIAVAAITTSSVVALSALGVFMLGAVLLLVGILISSVEFYPSNRAVHYEVLHGLSLGHDEETPVTLSQEEMALQKELDEKVLARARRLLDRRALIPFMNHRGEIMDEHEASIM